MYLNCIVGVIFRLYYSASLTFLTVSAYGDVFNRYWLMRTMFEFLDSSDLTTLTRDSENSVLHLVVNSELPVLLKYFLQKVDVELLRKKDTNNKTVFHCAAENCKKLKSFLSCKFLLVS